MTREDAMDLAQEECMRRGISLRDLMIERGIIATPEARRPGVCAYCYEPGHDAADCPEEPNEDEKDPRTR